MDSVFVEWHVAGYKHRNKRAVTPSVSSGNVGSVLARLSVVNAMLIIAIFNSTTHKLLNFTHALAQFNVIHCIKLTRNTQEVTLLCTQCL